MRLRAAFERRKVQIAIGIVVCFAIGLYLHFIVFATKKRTVGDIDIDGGVMDSESVKAKIAYLEQQLKISQDAKDAVSILFIIPTVSRKEDYLTPTLQSITSQTHYTSVFDTYHSPVRLMLVNHNLNSETHVVYEKLKKERQNSDKLMDFYESNKVKNAENKILQQTTDVVFNLELALGKYKSVKYVFLMEDDWHFCSNGMLALQYLIAKANNNEPNWIGLRCSYGLNGIVLKYDDIRSLITYYKNKMVEDAHQPPDHAIFFWMMSHKEKGRNIVSFRYNLFEHLGVESTFTGRESRYNPKCYQVLYDWLQEGERFHNEDCPRDDISPCAKQDQNTVLVDWDVSSEDLHRHHFPICPPSVTSEQEAKTNACRLK
jgi:hypothetical protein